MGRLDHKRRILISAIMASRRSTMGHSDLDPAVHARRPWNAGQNVGPKRPLKLRDIWAIRFYLDEHRRLRDRALFDLAIDSKLRGCDLAKIKIGDIVSGGHIRSRSTVIQQKTGRPVQFEIMTEAHKSLEVWLQRRGGRILDFVFPSRVDYLGHISTRQYARLLDEWVSTVGLDRREYGTHSMRRTKVSLIYKATGNLRAVQILLGHTNIENTVRHLGVDVDDALTLSERTEI
jgi:integrase